MNDDFDFLAPTLHKAKSKSTNDLLHDGGTKESNSRIEKYNSRVFDTLSTTILTTINKSPIFKRKWIPRQSSTKNNQQSGHSNQTTSYDYKTTIHDKQTTLHDKQTWLHDNQTTFVVKQTTIHDDEKEQKYDTDHKSHRFHLTKQQLNRTQSISYSDLSDIIGAICR